MDEIVKPIVDAIISASWEGIKMAPAKIVNSWKVLLVIFILCLSVSFIKFKPFKKVLKKMINFLRNFV